jgi:hypothetical protein
VEEFFEGIGNQLFGGQPFALVAPAIMFWTGGFLAWNWANGTFQDWSTTDVNTWLEAYAAAPALILVSLALIVVSSALAVALLTLPVLRLAEGYWPGWRWTRGARHWLTARIGKRLDRLETEWQTLSVRPAETLLPEERQTLAELDRRLRLAPADPTHRMPTPLGNILRAAELRPWEKYGLDPVVCWPRLWLLLPPEVQENITAARGSLDAATRTATWGVLVLAWTYWAPLAAPLIALLVVVLAARSMRTSAEVYGDLLESAFDLHRFALYRAVGWPLPACPAEERGSGQAVSEYLLRGTAPATMRFQIPDDG